MPRRVPLIATSALLLLLGAAFHSSVLAQSRPAPPRRPPDVLLKLSLEAETPGLAQRFTGITTNGAVEPGLFEIRSTGVGTQAVRDAATAFLATLTAAQRGETVFAIDDDEWRKWMNQSFYVRQGVSFLEMTDAQRTAAFRVLEAALSARGLTLTRDIMHLNTTLAELTDGNFEEYGEGRYHMTVMGTPSAIEPWGFQLDGHHAIVNYFVLGDQVVMSPFFAGSEPVIARFGKYAGTSILQDEQNRALAFVHALDEGKRAEQRQLADLIELYVGNMDDGHARVKMAEVLKHFDRTWFAWVGGTEPGSVFYYRIHSPVILIEFDHQRPIGIRHLLDPSVPTVEHIHTIVRTPNGNDYGKDLLRQHYERESHAAAP